MRSGSLSTRLLLWILPVTLVATLALSLSTYLIARHVILEETQQGLVAVTQAAAAEARAYFEQRHAELATVAQSPLFKDHYMNVEYGLAQEAGVYRREIERMLLDLSTRAKAYPRLSYLDAKGDEVCAVQDDRVDPPSRRFVDPAFFARVAGLKMGQRAVSAISRVPWHDAPVVRYGTPLRDEAGRLRGELIFTASLAPVYESLGALRLGVSGRSFLSMRGRAELTEGLPERLVLTSEAAIPGTPWSISTAVDRRDFLGPLAWVSSLTLLLALLGATALVLVLTRQVHQVLSPVNALADAAASYARGNLDARVAVAGSGEVAALSRAFNAMADSLKARTEALVESEARYRAAIENSPHAVVGLDQNFRITLWNRRAEAFFGYQPTEAYGRTLAVVLGDDAYARLRRRVETEGALRGVEVPGAARDGRRLELNLSWTGQSAAPGAAREWFVVIQDETDKKKLEAQLIQAEKMTALGNLTAGIAHELNNPLAAVTGFAELLLNELPLKPEQRDDMRHLHQSAMRCRDIVQGLLLYTRKVPTAPRRLSLNYVVQAALALFEYRLAKVDHVELEVELDPAGPQVAGEFQKLQQVLVNLVANAHDALRGKLGRRVISVRTRARPDGCELEIADNGLGVPPDKRRLIFEPFYTTKAAGKGTGLGLPIAQQIVDEFGGELRCAEGAGPGARFLARFPQCPADLPEPEPAMKLPPGTPGRRVLVVDDEPHLVSLMTRLLAEDGLNAGTAISVQDALEKLARDEFDLVIADIDLGPARGTELLKHGRRDGRGPDFVFITGDVMNRSLAEELSALNVPVLAKPFLRIEFLRLIRRVLSMRAASKLKRPS